MHFGRVTIVLALATGLTACGGEEETPEPAAAAPVVEQAQTEQNAATATAAAASVLSRFGGALVAASEHFVEVLPFTGGAIQASVLNSQGEPVVGTSNMQLTVRVQGADEEMHPATLAWNETSGTWVGSVEGNVDVVTGPVEVTLAQGGTSSRGRVEAVAVAPQPSHGGTVIVAGQTAAEITADADGNVQAYFVDGRGEPLTSAIAGEVTVNVHGADEQPHGVQLTWSPETHAYVGSAGEVTMAQAGPMELTVAVNGSTQRGRVHEVALSQPAARGGYVAVAGDYNVEVVPKEGGQIEAFVLDASGRPAQPQGAITVQVGGRALQMRWDAESGSYKAAAADVDFAAHPVQVVIAHGGRRRYGGVRVRVAPPGRAPVAGVQVAPVAVQAPGLQVQIGAQQTPAQAARVQIGGGMAPGVRVQIGGGSASPMMRVNVAAPEPSGGMVRVRVGGGGSPMVRVNVSSMSSMGMASGMGNMRGVRVNVGAMVGFN